MMPDIRQLEHLADLVWDGCSGFILCEETARGLYPQICIETLQLVAGPDPLERFGREGAELGGMPRLLQKHFDQV